MTGTVSYKTCGESDGMVKAQPMMKASHISMPAKITFQPDQSVFIKDGSNIFEATFKNCHGVWADVLLSSGETKVIPMTEIYPKLTRSPDGPAPTSGLTSHHESATASERSHISEAGSATRRDSINTHEDSDTTIHTELTTPSWADIGETAGASSTYSRSEPSVAAEEGTAQRLPCDTPNPPEQRGTAKFMEQGKVYYDDNGNKLPAWLGPKDRFLCGYTKMWYYNKYWGYVEPFEADSHDVFLHGGKVVNSKKNVTKAQKKRERGIRVPDNEQWLAEYSIVPKLVRYQKVLMTDFFMNTEEKEGRRLAANTIVVIDPSWNKTKALGEVKAHKGVKIFEDKKHNIDRVLWKVGEECLARWEDGELYSAVIADIKKAEYPNLPTVRVEWREFRGSQTELTFRDIEITAMEKRLLDARRCSNGRAAIDARAAMTSSHISICSDSTVKSNRRGNRDRNNKKQNNGNASHGRSSKRSSRNHDRRNQPQARRSNAEVPAGPPQWETARTPSPEPQPIMRLNNRNKRPRVAKAVVLASAGPTQNQPQLQDPNLMPFLAMQQDATATGQEPSSPLALPPQAQAQNHQYLPQTMQPQMMHPAMQPYMHNMVGMTPMPQPNNPYIQQQNWQQQQAMGQQQPGSMQQNVQVPMAMNYNYPNPQLVAPSDQTSIATQSTTQQMSESPSSPNSWSQVQPPASQMAATQAPGAQNWSPVTPQGSVGSPQVQMQQSQMQQAQMQQAQMQQAQMQQAQMQGGVPSWQPQSFGYLPPAPGISNGTIAMGMFPFNHQMIPIVDSQGRWLCRGCGNKNQAAGVNCQHCGAQREMRLIPVNHMVGGTGFQSPQYQQQAGFQALSGASSPIMYPGQMPMTNQQLMPNAYMPQAHQDTSTVPTTAVNI